MPDLFLSCFISSFRETFSESSYDQWSNEVRAILLYNFLVVNYDSLKFQLQDYFEAALDQEKFIKILYEELKLQCPYIESMFLPSNLVWFL